MRIAAQKLVGVHDYRNFCKIDVVNVLNFVREIRSISIEPLGNVVEMQQTNAGAGAGAGVGGNTDSGDIVTLQPNTSVWAFTITGTAFLWHQVRCMVAILFLVGQGLENANVCCCSGCCCNRWARLNLLPIINPVQIIEQLLDIEATPRKPSYEMADPEPLVLWHCEYQPPIAFSTDAGSDRSSSTQCQTNA
jgi:tRNA pseudouridine38/39 synthase